MDPLSELVSDDGALVSRRLYHDPEIYRLEQQRVFGRSWLFLGHESQIAKPGDFFLSTMGQESVIVTRDRSDAIRVHLNTCRHRGMRVCREDAGSARAFTCPYHGWSYGVDGALVGVPNQRESFGESFDKSGLGLIPVAQVETFRGLIFANFDPTACTLTEWLGDMAFYLDTSLDRRGSGTEVIGGIQKWRIETNWKMPAENQIGDVAHGPVSHASVFTMARMSGGADADKAMNDILVHGRNVALQNGHGLTVRFFPEDQPEDWLPGEKQLHEIPEVGEYLREVQAEAEERLGPLRKRLKIATGTVYPTFSILGSNNTIRVAHPRGPTTTDYWAWVLVDKEAPPVVKDTLRRFYIMTFGPGGIFEQDDGENWEEVTAGAQGVQASKHPFHFHMGMGQEGPHPELPGEVCHVHSEHTQRRMYRFWRDQMERA